MDTSAGCSLYLFLFFLISACALQARESTANEVDGEDVQPIVTTGDEGKRGGAPWGRECGILQWESPNCVRCGPDRYNRAAAPGLDVRWMTMRSGGWLWGSCSLWRLHYLSGWNDIKNSGCDDASLTSPILNKRDIDRFGERWEGSSSYLFQAQCTRFSSIER